MKSYPMYSLVLERRSAELQQAVIRILLSVITCLVLVKHHLDLGSMFQGSITSIHVLVVSVVFLLYSVAIWVFEMWLPNYLKVTMVTASITDIIIITLLMHMTLYTEIPFYIWYIFYVVNISSKYGWQYSIMALSASIVSFSWVLGLYSSAAFSPFALGSIGYLLVLAFMFGQISERQLTYQAFLAVVNEFRAELSGIATSRDIMSHVLERTRGLLKVEHAFFLPASRGADASQAPGLRSQGSDPAILATFREGGGPWNVEEVLREQRPIMSNKIPKEIRLADPSQAWSRVQNVAAAPMMVRTVPVGVLYVANRRDKSLSKTDLLLLEVIATQIAPVIENALLWERLREAAAAEERLRIARDLHDSVLQTLAAINIHVERCRILIDKDTNRAQQGLEKIHEISTHGLAEVRTYLSELRMVGPEPAKFDSTVRKMCEEAASRNNIEVAVNIDISNEALSPLVSSVAFQVLRELVNNAVMHSGGSKIDVDIDILEDILQIQVHDNGAGFAVESTRARKATTGHLGLVGVEERVRAIKGRFELSSEPDDGTTATVKLPM